MLPNKQLIKEDGDAGKDTDWYLSLTSLLLLCIENDYQYL